MPPAEAAYSSFAMSSDGMNFLRPPSPASSVAATGVPQVGQNAAPAGRSASHEEHEDVRPSPQDMQKAAPAGFTVEQFGHVMTKPLVETG
jgi:hypothetical protein